MNGTNLLAAGTTAALLLATGASMAQQERGTPPSAETMAPSGAKHPTPAGRQNDRAQNTPAGGNQTPHGQVGEAPQNRGRPETTGQVPREDQPNRPNERASEPSRGDTKGGRSSERTGPAPATAQVPRDEQRRGRESEQSGATARTPLEDERNRASDQERRKADREDRVGTAGRDAAGTRKNISISTEKRNQIHEAIAHDRNAPRLPSVNFDVSVGGRIPHGVRFAAVPDAIVEIEPAWRGLEFFVIRDEIVIVDPRSLEIVAIVDA